MDWISRLLMTWRVSFLGGGLACLCIWAEVQAGLPVVPEAPFGIFVQNKGDLPDLVPRPPLRPVPWPPLDVHEAAYAQDDGGLRDIILAQYLGQIRLRLDCYGEIALCNR